MKFSVFHIAMGRGRESERQVYEDLLSDIVLADKLAFDVFWLAEHHFNANFSLSPCPNVLLGAAAAMTKRIKLGTAISVLPFHNPIRIAEEGAMIDLLSGGRYQWGIGRGITGHEFEGFGVSASDSTEIFREFHDCVLNAWASGDLGWDGKHVKIPKGTVMVPEITQKPCPPVWITAQSPATVEWAAQHGYPALQVGESISASKTQLQRYRDALSKAGRAADPRGEIVPLRYIHVADTEQEVREVVAPQIMDWYADFTAIAAPKADVAPTKGYEYWQESKSQENLSADEKRTQLFDTSVKGYDYWRNDATNIKRLTGSLTFDELNEAGVIVVGTAKQVVKLLEKQISELELKHLLCDFWRSGRARADRQRSMQLFSEQVIPHFQ